MFRNKLCSMEFFVFYEDLRLEGIPTIAEFQTRTVL